MSIVLCGDINLLTFSCLHLSVSMERLGVGPLREWSWWGKVELGRLTSSLFSSMERDHRGQRKCSSGREKIKAPGQQKERKVKPGSCHRQSQVSWKGFLAVSSSWWKFNLSPSGSRNQLTTFPVLCQRRTSIIDHSTPAYRPGSRFSIYTPGTPAN